MKLSRALVIRDRMSFTWPFLLGPVFFRTALPCSGGYHLERGVLPLLDAVWVNCKKGATTELKAQVSSILAKWCMFDDCLCVI